MTSDNYERRIDGKTFYGVDFTHDKTIAKEKADKWREKRHLARVIKQKEKRDVFFVVYIYPPP